MKLKWGILGLGKIANKFAKDLAMVENCELVAVASRSLEKANAFGKEYGAKNFHSSYEALFNNSDVDIIYIATPHSSHMLYALQALNHKKHVLCEKPLAINKIQVQQLIDASRANHVFLMEAFWTRFNPTFEAVLQRVQNKEIGEVNYVNADFSFFRDADPASRMLNMELAGGSLLDIGVYPVFLSYMLLGYPEQIVAVANKHETGADIQMSAILKYPKGIANLMSGFRSPSDMIARIYGTGGSIYIDKVWHESEGYKVEVGDQLTAYSLPKKGKGFTYEIEECLQCIKEGRIESEKWSHQDSLNLISICDEIRSQIGVKYPFE
ncbi:MAG: Gfo/Idh/MocA family oxidoreductase [Saprospiraceae bacterium]|nr:Gfo/Idh/MocA family oxidoreductase [Saprospiraceae bacterium]